MISLLSASNSLIIANKGLIVFLSRWCIFLVEYFKVLKETDLKKKANKKTL